MASLLYLCAAIPEIFDIRDIRDTRDIRVFLLVAHIFPNQCIHFHAPSKLAQSRAKNASLQFGSVLYMRGGLDVSHSCSVIPTYAKQPVPLPYNLLSRRTHLDIADRPLACKYADCTHRDNTTSNLTKHYVQ